MSGGKRSTAYNRDMPEQDNKKRWRPRWSIRILLIVITLICAYLACWGPTKSQGVQDVENHLNLDYYEPAEMVVPLVVTTVEEEYSEHQGFLTFYSFRRYYFWFFGYVAKLPFEKEVPHQPPPVSLPTDPH